MGKSRIFAEAIVGNRLWVDVCDELLTSYLEKNWVDFWIGFIFNVSLRFFPGRREN
jgi:hypothetical protein